MGLPVAMTAASRLFSVLLSAGLLAGSGQESIRTFPFNKGKLPDADTLIDSMCKVHIDARELVMLSKNWSHELVVFVYPPGSNRVWAWDPDSKTRELHANPTDSQAVANAWAAIIVPDERVLSSFYRIPSSANHCLPGNPLLQTG
jgi:hypothetical protein